MSMSRFRIMTKKITILQLDIQPICCKPVKYICGSYLVRKWLEPLIIAMSFLPAKYILLVSTRFKSWCWTSEVRTQTLFTNRLERGYNKCTTTVLLSNLSLQESQMYVRFPLVNSISIDIYIWNCRSRLWFTSLLCSSNLVIVPKKHSEHPSIVEGERPTSGRMFSEWSAE